MRIVAAPDKFRGTATAAEVAAAIAAAGAAFGAVTDEVPMSDGGEGFLDVFGGPNRTTRVTGPLGAPVDAAWRFEGGTAFVETARASGLTLVGGPEGNDPLSATTTGVGELIVAAVDAGARRVVVGHGGSASTDGGLGALGVLGGGARLRGVELVAVVDVTTSFLEAAEEFAPQKGATRKQVELLRRRLDRLAQMYLDDYGVDVVDEPGGGAAGGLAGGLIALGARCEFGVDLIAEELDLAGRIEEADLVITGEGRVDRSSFIGKTVGGVVQLAYDLGVPVVVVAGDVEPRSADDLQTISLVDMFGERRAFEDTTGCVTAAVERLLAMRG